MGAVLTVSVVAARLVLLPAGGLILLRRKFDRTYDGLEWSVFCGSTVKRRTEAPRRNPGRPLAFYSL
jgi:hypothetical protein